MLPVQKKKKISSSFFGDRNLSGTLLDFIRGNFSTWDCAVGLKDLYDSDPVHQDSLYYV